MKPVSIVVACGIGLAVLGAPARAQEQDKVQIHGFASQTFLKTRDNVYLSLPKSPDGTFEYTEAALNFNYTPSNKLRVGAQFIGRDVGPQGNHRVAVDWALGDYRVRDEFGVRAGKVKLSTGLYNTVMDADVARPEILQPESIYPATQRDFRNAVSGVQVYGTLALGPVGYLDYEGWTGTVDLDEAYISRRVANDAARGLLPVFQLAGLRGTTFQVGQADGRLDTFFGGTLEYRPPVAGLRIRATLTEADAYFTNVVTFSGTQGPLPVSLPVTSNVHYDQKYQFYIGAEYQRGGLRLSFEDWRNKGDAATAIGGLPVVGSIERTTTQRASGRYGQAVYRFNPHLQLGGYYSVYYPDRDDKDGAKLVAAGDKDFRGWQKDLAFHGRCDITPNWLVKLEYHVIDGAAHLSPSDNPQGFRKDWNMFLARVTFHF